MRLSAHNLAVHLPDGWDGRIYARTVEAPDRLGAGRSAAPPAQAATLHAANFALPTEDGDFGTRATGAMSERSIFLALTEYVEGNGLRAGEGLFSSTHLPRDLRPTMFSPRTLLLGRPGQAGFQHFFTHQERPFCLYAVLGSSQRAGQLVPSLNQVLRTVEVAAVHPRGE